MRCAVFYSASMIAVGVQYALTDLNRARTLPHWMEVWRSTERPSRCPNGALPISNLPFSTTILLAEPAFRILPLPAMAFPSHRFDRRHKYDRREISRGVEHQ